MFDSQARSAPGSIEEAVDFRFSVTWSTLLAPSATAQEAQTAKAMFALVSAGERPPSNAKAIVQWEIVVPKVVRSPATANFPAAEQSFPNLYQPRGRNGWKLLLGPALVAAIVVPVWRQTIPSRSKAKAVEAATDTRGGGWVRQIGRAHV